MASAPCRRSLISQSLAQQSRVEQDPRPSTIGQVCRDLEELVAAGFLEVFRDEYNIVRYRPVNGRIA